MKGLTAELKFELKRLPTPPDTVAKAIADVQKWIAAMKSTSNSGRVGAVNATTEETGQLKRQLSQVQSQLKAL